MVFNEVIFHRAVKNLSKEKFANMGEFNTKDWTTDL